MYLKKGKKNQRELGSEWGYFGKTKDLMVWSCNMKQLNFRHFNINTKKFAVTVIFFQNETQPAPKKQYYFVSTYSHLFQKISENYRIYPKMSNENRRFSRRNPKIFKEQIRIDNAKRL